MRNGYKIIDMDTHVGPSLELLEERMDAKFQPRLKELDDMMRINAGSDGVAVKRLVPAAIAYDRFPGEAPAPEDTETRAGGRGALEGRTIKMHRGTVQADVDSNSASRLKDMDLEGRDIDFIFPATWAPGVATLPDPSFARAYYAAYHRYMDDYCAAAPDRLKSHLCLLATDPQWSVAEINKQARKKWPAACALYLPQGMPVDHPELDPIWTAMSDADLPLVHHSFFIDAPYFPGYRDIWGNAVVARTAAHVWGAQRLFSYLVVGGIFDRFPNFRAAVCETGHGWVPAWAHRLEFMLAYIKGCTPELKCPPTDYIKQGRFCVGAEAWEDTQLTEACLNILGEDFLMHQSDYPHGQCYFPETAQVVMDWPLWKNRDPSALSKYLYGNAARFLRLA